MDSILTSNEAINAFMNNKNINTYAVDLFHDKYYKLAEMTLQEIKNNNNLIFIKGCDEKQII